MSKQKLVKEYLSKLTDAEKRGKIHVVFQKTVVDANDEPEMRFIFDCYWENDFPKVKKQLESGNSKKLRGTPEIIWNPKKDYKPKPIAPPEPSAQEKEIAALKAELAAEKEKLEASKSANKPPETKK